MHIWIVILCMDFIIIYNVKNCMFMVQLFFSWNCRFYLFFVTMNMVNVQNDSFEHCTPSRNLTVSQKKIDQLEIYSLQTLNKSL